MSPKGNISRLNRRAIAAVILVHPPGSPGCEDDGGRRARV